MAVLLRRKVTWRRRRRWCESAWSRTIASLLLLLQIAEQIRSRETRTGVGEHSRWWAVELLLRLRRRQLLLELYRALKHLLALGLGLSLSKKCLHGILVPLRRGRR